MKTIVKVMALVALPLLSAWAEAALASRAQGHLGFLGLAKESSWGTAVAATYYVELLSENISTGIDRFPTRNIFGGFYDPDDYALRGGHRWVVTVPPGATQALAAAYTVRLSAKHELAGGNRRER